MRRTGKEGLHSRVIQMDLKDLVNELEEKEAEGSFVCEGGYLRCPRCECQLDKTRIEPHSERLLDSTPVRAKKESAAELCKRLGFEEPSEEQKRQNLNDNLDYYLSQVGTK